MAVPLRVFLSSPADVNAERDRAKHVIEKLNAERPDVGTFELIRWEDAHYTAVSDFQAQIPLPSQCDIVLCILWTRLGTPLPTDRYMREDGSTYAGGTEYEFEEASAAARDRGVPDVFMYRKIEEVVFRAETATGDLVKYQALHSFWEKWFRSVDGHLTAGFTEFGTTDDFERRLERHLRHWLEHRPRAVEWLPVRGSPFRGLSAFREEHAAVFFGRDHAVRQAKARLVAAGARGTPYLLILGMSGSGKSSLVQAGLLPRLTERGAVSGVDVWRKVLVRPGQLGEDPTRVLAGKLLASGVLPELADGDFADLETLAGQLADPHRAHVPIRGALERIAAKAQKHGAYDRPLTAKLLIYVDQLEELFALRTEVRERFSAVLDQLVRTGLVWVVATLRSDAYPSYQVDDALVALKSDGAHLDLRPPGDAEIAEIIRKPAEAAGFRFESDGERELDRLLEDAARAPGSLPLLEFTLDELYTGRDRDRSLLTLAAYDALGGLEGAIERRAESVFLGLPERSRSTLPRVLRSLVRVDGDGNVRRHYADLSEHVEDPDRRILVESFIEARLFNTDGIDQPVVSVAHEALFTHWARARHLVHSDRSDIELGAWLHTEAERWRLEHGKSRKHLLERGARLDAANGLVDRRHEELPGTLVEFVERSVATARRQGLIRALWASGAIVLLVFAFVTSTVLWLQAEDARERAVATLARSDFLEGNRLVESGEASRGLAYLVRAMRGGSEAAGSRVWDLLARRSWPLLTAATLGSTSQVVAAAFSPDGSRVLTAVTNSAVRLWDIETRLPVWEAFHHMQVGTVAFDVDGSRVITSAPEAGQELRVSDAATGDVITDFFAWPVPWTSTTAFSRDGTRFVTGSRDGTVLVWDVATGELVAPPSWRAFEPTVAAFSRDGSRIVTSWGDGTVRVWDVVSGALMSGGMQPYCCVVDAMVNLDGSRIVTRYRDRTVRTWDVATGALLGEAALPYDVRSGPVFSSDGSRVVTVSPEAPGSVFQNSVRVWDVATGRMLADLSRPHEGRILVAGFNADGSQIVMGSRSGMVRVFDVETGEPLHEVWLPNVDEIYSSFLSPDGSMIATQELFAPLRVWDVETGALKRESPRIPSSVKIAAFSSDGATLAFGTFGGHVHVWNLETGEPPVEASESHDDYVTVAAFSADGSRFVTGSADRTAQVWDASTGAPLGEPLAHDGVVTSVALDPGGSMAVTRSLDGVARVWDVATGAHLNELVRHAGEVRVAAFSANGSKIVTGSDDRTARVWSAASGSPIGAPLRHDAAVAVADFSPDASIVVTGSSDGTARLWDAETGSPLGEPLRHGGAVTTVAFDPEGSRVVTGSADRTAQVWVAETGASLTGRMWHDGGVTVAAFSPDGSRIVTGSKLGDARLWDTETGTLLEVPLRHENGVNVATFSPDGSLVLTASEYGPVRVWETAQRAPLTESLLHDRGVTTIAFSSDGARLFTASTDGTARVWDVASGSQLGEVVQHEAPVVAAVFSPDRARIVTRSEGGVVRDWDVETGASLNEGARHASEAEVAALSPDGTRIVTGNRSGLASVTDVGSGTVQTRALDHVGVVAVAFSADGSKVATGSTSGTARVWDAATGAFLSEIMTEPGGVEVVAFSHDGAQVLTGSDVFARVWDAEMGTPVSEPMLHDDVVLAALFSADDARIVTESVVGTVRVWDVATGDMLSSASRNDGQVTITAFSNDGTRMVTGSLDGVARVWDVATGAPVSEPMQHSDAVTAAVFSPDGTRIATGSLDRTVRVWDAPAATAPSWAADLAEALGGYRLSEQGVIEPVTTLHERQPAAQLSEADTGGDDPWSLLVRWLLAPTSDRMISPLSHQRAP